MAGGSGIIITNTIKKINEEIIEIPLIIRSNQKGWVPTFDIWPTKIDEDTSFIDCTQNFRPKLKKYYIMEINPKIGYYDGINLFIFWKALVNTADLDKINRIYNGKLKATCWQNRYCTYYGTDNDMQRLHSVILYYYEQGYVIHHIDGVASDNRHRNLHILPKREHDSITHPCLDERKKMFADPQKYWRTRKILAIDQFVKELSLLIMNEWQGDFIAKFAEENIALAKEIMDAARIYFNLSHLKTKVSRNRELNFHLRSDYLDTYEIEKYLKKCVIKQLKFF
jgi:hypothetical protein